MLEWEAYDRLEPIGEKRGDYRTALLCMHIENLAKAGWGGKNIEFSTINDFLKLMEWDKELEPVEEVPEKKPTPQALLSKQLLTWAKAAGAVVKKRTK